MMNVVVLSLVVSAWTALGLDCSRSARRCRAQQAEWDEFRRGHVKLDRELDRIWDCL
jgi:hypothetical protein